MTDGMAQHHGNATGVFIPYEYLNSSCSALLLSIVDEIQVVALFVVFRCCVADVCL